MKMIPLEECRDNFLYKLDARNIAFGVFIKSNSGFIGLRYKFGVYRLDTEYHWDTGEPFGTAIPVQEIIKVPNCVIKLENVLFYYLYIIKLIACLINCAN